VDDSLRDIPKVTRSTTPNPLIEALVAGKTVFVEVEDGDKLNGLYDAARRRGFRFNSRKHRREDGTVGHVGWFEVREPIVEVPNAV
jgi:hypothetical protein